MFNINPRSFLKWGLVLAIIIVLNLFFIVSTQLVFEEPQYNDFCKAEPVRVVPEAKDECLAIGGQWNEDSFIQKGIPRAGTIEPVPLEMVRQGYCDQDFTCRQEYEDARAMYERNFFIVLVILGTATLIGSYFVRAYEAVMFGFASGGIITLIIASTRYWSHMSDYLKVAVLGIALAALVFVGIKWFQKREE
ncbi:MAG: hypothetical protein HYS74_00630 [Parcubacteria group bacterium]|nr:hypothetical protein [Parcubacteria group bacterium]